ncbi:unnamed protein product [Dibothriocephalus latus]|uniref:XK-related protein n=1 Tax=Dibothriocephalus latus TaxID=60516 RepID=A0A3P7L1J3_DIBLA|nr:unnamed protein product [Dibothriocephalus latus]
MDDCQEVLPVIEIRENLQQAPTSSEAIEEEIIPMHKTKCNFQPTPSDSEVKGEKDDSSIDQNLCTKFKDWSSEKWAMLKAPVGQVDLATDIYTTCKFYINFRFARLITIQPGAADKTKEKNDWSSNDLHATSSTFSLDLHRVLLGINSAVSDKVLLFADLAYWRRYILTIFSSLSSLLALSWASSGLWFAVRDHMYYPSPCEFFQLSSLLYFLCNVFMLSGRLLALSYFAALIGLMPLVYVVLAQACMAILTDLLVNWGHAARSEQSKENVVSRLLETCSLVFDVPFSITFMSGPARKGCYCLWFFETLFLVVFSFCWPSQRQEHTATNATLTVLETSSDLKSFLLALVLDQNICEFSAMLEANWNVMGDLELLPEVFSKVC